MNKECKHLLSVDDLEDHPGGTWIETFPLSPRCALKPKTDNAGRTHQVIRWVFSGGSPVTVAFPCSGNCPLEPGYRPMIDE